MEKTTLYNRKTTSSTNLWSANLNEVSKETDLSRASWFYSYDLQQFVEYGEKEGQSSTVRGSLMVPVKPGDKIYCSSFQSQSITGGAQDGICVAYFDKDGKLLRSVSAAEVYAEFTGNDKQYITVPDGAWRTTF